MEPQDYILDNNDAMVIDTTIGDWSVGPTNEIDADLILNTTQGNWGQSPLCGAGMMNYLNADLGKSDMTFIEKNIQMQLKANNFSSPDASLLISNGSILGVTIEGDRQI